MRLICPSRDLLRQLRIRLHIHFFLSLAASSLTTILWYLLVHLDLLINPLKAARVIDLNPASLSRLI